MTGDPQPMATAPKDGRWVHLIFCTPYGAKWPSTKPFRWTGQRWTAASGLSPSSSIDIVGWVAA